MLDSEVLGAPESIKVTVLYRFRLEDGSLKEVPMDIEVAPESLKLSMTKPVTPTYDITRQHVLDMKTGPMTFSIEGLEEV